MHSEPIRHLLLDLGGVLYGVDYGRTAHALGLSPQQLAALLNDPSLIAYECGQLSTEAFLEHWQKRFSTHSRAQLIAAWNAMLLGPLPETPAVLQQLMQRFSLAVLSNTNDLHFEQVAPAIAPWKPYFVEIFFSHHIGRRKPDPETYRYVLDRLGWAPQHTLFVDDSPANVAGARAAGLRAWLMHLPNQPLSSLPFFLKRACAQSGYKRYRTRKLCHSVGGRKA